MASIDILAIPKKDSPFFDPLDGLTPWGPEELSTVVAAFKNNLIAAADVVTLPYMLGESCLLESGLAPNEEDVLPTIENAVKSGDLREALEEVLRQAAVLIWSAFEVLSRDVFVLVLNKEPWMCSRLMADIDAGKLFSSKFNLTDLAGYDFNLSESMGDVLTSRRSPDRLEDMKKVYAALFPEASSLRDALKKKTLRTLNQRRHLIVHKRGFVDERYRKNTSEELDIGSRVSVSIDDLREYLTVTLDCGVELVKCAEDYLSDRPF